MAKRDKDLRIASIAARQMGLVRREQLLRLGLTGSDLHRRMKAGTLQRVLPRVYRLPGVPETWESLVLASLFWAGPQAVVSHRAAAKIHGLNVGECECADLTVTKDLRCRSSWINVHLSTDLSRKQVQNRGPFTVTNPTRTLIDLAGVVPPDEFELLAEEGLSRRLTSPEGIDRMLAQLHHRGRPGIEVVRDFLAKRAPGGAAESPPEVRLLKLLRGAGLPDPVRQLSITLPTGVVVRPDLVYPEVKLAIEFDSYRFHSGLRSWGRDRSRRNELSAMGWIVLQATYQDLLSPDRFLRQVRAIFAARRVV